MWEFLGADHGIVCWNGENIAESHVLQYLSFQYTYIHILGSNASFFGILMPEGSVFPQNTSLRALAVYPQLSLQEVPPNVIFHWFGFG
jgi:hypothetical protein